MINWAHAGPTVLAAFLASLVEFIEALTIVLAVGAIAIAIAAWLGVCWLLLLRSPLDPFWSPPILFAGLALILVGSARRRACQS